MEPGKVAQLHVPLALPAAAQANGGHSASSGASSAAELAFMSAVLQSPGVAQEAFAAAQRELAALNGHHTQQQEQGQAASGASQQKAGGMPIGMAPAEAGNSGELDLSQLLGLSGPPHASNGGGGAPAAQL